MNTAYNDFSSNISKVQPFNIQMLERAGYCLLHMEMIATHEFQLQIPVLEKRVPGFKRHPSKNDYLLAKIQPEIVQMQLNCLHQMVDYINMLANGVAKVDASNVASFVVTCAQLTKTTVDLHKGVYQVKIADKVTPIAIKNCFCHMKPEVKEMVTSLGPSLVEESSLEGHLLVSSIMIAYKLHRKTEDQPAYLDMRSIPQGIRGLQVAKMTNNSWENPALQALVNSIQKDARAMTDMKKVVDLAMHITTKIMGTAHVAAMRQMSAMLNPAFKKFDLNKCVSQNLTTMAAVVAETKLNKSAMMIMKQYDTGCARVSTALKIVPPAAFLATTFSNYQLKYRSTAQFYGAAGLGHYNVLSTYFHLVCYDLSFMTIDPSEENPQKGKVNILYGNIYDKLPVNKGYLISDVYSKKTHGPKGQDPYMHKLVTAFLLNEQYNSFGNQPCHFNGVMLKARIPTDVEFHAYDKTYPFIACATGALSSAEFYIVKHFDIENKSVYDIVCQEMILSGSSRIKDYCHYINDSDSFYLFCKMLMGKAITAQVMFYQVPVMDFSLKLNFPGRDWPLWSFQMPIMHIPLKLRRLCPAHLASSSKFFEMVKAGSFEEQFEAYSRAEQAEKPRESTAEVPPSTTTQDTQETPAQVQRNMFDYFTDAFSADNNLNDDVDVPQYQRSPPVPQSVQVVVPQNTVSLVSQPVHTTVPQDNDQSVQPIVVITNIPQNQVQPMNNSVPVVAPVNIPGTPPATIVPRVVSVTQRDPQVTGDNSNRGRGGRKGNDAGSRSSSSSGSRGRGRGKGPVYQRK